MLRPWGVDAVSGVEAAPGRKDPAKVREFVARARAAERKPYHFLNADRVGPQKRFMLFAHNALCGIMSS
jgi:hypothetical protein